MKRERDHDRSAFEERTRAVFERSVADLDAGTRSKLTRARLRALRELERPALARQWLAGNAQTVAAALAVAAAGVGWLVVSTLSTPEAPMSPVGIAEVSDFELLLGDDDLELIEELEFYAWLEEQPELRSSDDAGAG